MTYVLLVWMIFVKKPERSIEKLSHTEKFKTF